MRIIQFLNWKIDKIIPYLSQVSQQGFDTIQINAVQPFKKVEGQEWWATYQPLDFQVGNVYGSKEDLKRLCQEAEKYKLSIVVDVITNHLANNGAGQEIVPHYEVNKEIRNNPDCWKKHHKICEFNNYQDVIQESIGLPGLNLNNKDLQQRIISFLTDLKDCGVSGFRFDAAKHIGLPSDGVDFFEVIKEFLDKYHLFAYGEFLDGPSELGEDYNQLLMQKKNELTKYMYILTQESSQVDDNNKKVTYVESHDTYLNTYGETRNDDINTIIDRYAELTKKYENTLFYVRDLKRGQRLSTEDPDRSKDADLSWIDNNKIRNANFEVPKQTNNLNNRKKESEKMGNKEKMKKLHSELSNNFHNILINQVTNNNTLEDDLLIAFYDYKVQLLLKDLLGVNEYDDFSLRCALSDIFQKKSSYRVSGRTFEDFLSEAREALSKERINQDVFCGHNKTVPDSKTNRQNNLEVIKDNNEKTKKDKIMALYSRLCISLHGTIADNITSETPKEEAMNLVLLDYKITQMLNDILGVVPHDEFILDSIVDDLYETNQEKYKLKGISKNEFYIRLLNILKARSINNQITDGIDTKIRKLVR